jgi:hypothetical protein
MIPRGILRWLLWRPFRAPSVPLVPPYDLALSARRTYTVNLAQRGTYTVNLAQRGAL